MHFTREQFDHAVSQMPPAQKANVEKALEAGANWQDLIGLVMQFGLPILSALAKLLLGLQNGPAAKTAAEAPTKKS